MSYIFLAAYMKATHTEWYHGFTSNPQGDRRPELPRGAARFLNAAAEWICIYQCSRRRTSTLPGLDTAAKPIVQ